MIPHGTRLLLWLEEWQIEAVVWESIIWRRGDATTRTGVAGPVTTRRRAGRWVGRKDDDESGGFDFATGLTIG